MARSRLFRTIVVFGSSLGAATVFGAAVSTVSSGCELYEATPHHGWPIIDAAIPDALCGDGGYCPDARWGIIDAALPDAKVIDGGWGTIADAPNHDLPPPAPTDHEDVP